MTLGVLISYDAADRDVAQAVCGAREGAAIPCWIAPRDVVPGARHAQAIVDAVRGSRVLLLGFSAVANASAQVERELGRVVACGLPIVPLRSEDVTPAESLKPYLAGQHRRNALAAPREQHLPGLAEAVYTLTEAPAAPAGPLGEPAAAGMAHPQADRTAAPASATVSRQERKAVTTLICDLVGFTAMGEAAGPEGFDALLDDYLGCARRVIESHGGTVDKFIGNAVAAVFDAPAAGTPTSDTALLGCV